MNDRESPGIAARSARHGHNCGAFPRAPVLLTIPSAVDPHAREQARSSRSRCSAPPDERS